MCINANHFLVAHNSEEIATETVVDIATAVVAGIACVVADIASAVADSASVGVVDTAVVEGIVVVVEQIGAAAGNIASAEDTEPASALAVDRGHKMVGIHLDHLMESILLAVGSRRYEVLMGYIEKELHQQMPAVLQALEVSSALVDSVDLVSRSWMEMVKVQGCSDLIEQLGTL